MTRDSIKSRMIRVLLLWLIFSWLASLGAMYIYTSNSETSNWDEKLEFIAIRMAEIIPPNIVAARAQSITSNYLHAGTADKNELALQIWRGDDELIAKTPNAPDTPLKTDFVEGFSNSSASGKEWRSYSRSNADGTLHVQVGVDRHRSTKSFQAHAAKSLSIASACMAVAGLIMWWPVRSALKSVSALAQTMRNRSRYDLTPIKTRHLPLELHSFVDSFNELLSQLDHAIKMERQLISDAAHELRTPLAALQAQFDVLQQAHSEAERSRALKTLALGVRRTSRLSEQLLDSARLEAGMQASEHVMFDLKEIVTHVADEFEIQAIRSNREIRIAGSPSLVPCNLDEVGILLRNLIDNALRYTDDHGTVEVSCGHTNHPDGLSFCWISVADDGPGVPPSEYGKIFDRHHRMMTNGNVRGSGIGLALVARVAQHHGATIEVSSGLSERGLRITVQFPNNAIA